MNRRRVRISLPKFDNGGEIISKDGYEFKKDGDKYLTRIKGAEEWVVATGKPLQHIKFKIYGEGKDPETASQKEASHIGRMRDIFRDDEMFWSTDIDKLSPKMQRIHEYAVGLKSGEKHNPNSKEGKEFETYTKKLASPQAWMKLMPETMGKVYDPKNDPNKFKSIKKGWGENTPAQIEVAQARTKSFGTPNQETVDFAVSQDQYMKGVYANAEASGIYEDEVRKAEATQQRLQTRYESGVDPHTGKVVEPWKYHGMTADQYYDWMQRDTASELIHDTGVSTVMELTGLPSAFRVAKDPWGTAKGVGNTIMDLAAMSYTPSSITALSTGKNPITGNEMWSGIGQTGDALTILPGIGLLGDIFKAGKAMKPFASLSKGRGVHSVMGDLNKVDGANKVLRDRIIESLKKDDILFGQGYARKRGTALDYDETVDLVENLYTQNPSLGSKDFPIYFHGTTSATLPGLSREGGLLPLGELMKKGKAPLSGEVVFGGAGINQKGISSVFIDELPEALRYSNMKQSKTPLQEFENWWTTGRPEYVKLLEEAQGRSPFYTQEGLALLDDITTQRAHIWEGMTDIEKGFSSEQFPVLYGMKPKRGFGADRITIPRSDVPGEVLLQGRVDLDEIPSIFVPKNKIETVRGTLPKGSNIDVLPIEGLSNWNRLPFGSYVPSPIKTASKDSYLKRKLFGSQLEGRPGVRVKGYDKQLQKKFNYETGELEPVITHKDINKMMDEKEAWMRSDEYIARRQASTGETKAQIQENVEQIISEANKSRIDLDRSFRNPKDRIQNWLYGVNAEGYYDKAPLTFRKRVRIKNASGGSSKDEVIKHEIDHMYSSVDDKDYYPTLTGNVDNSYLQLPIENQVRMLNLQDDLIQRYDTKVGGVTKEHLENFLTEYFRGKTKAYSGRDYSSILNDEMERHLFGQGTELQKKFGANTGEWHNKRVEHYIERMANTLEPIINRVYKYGGLFGTY